MLLVFEPVELVARLAAMLPKPGSNAISYHGVLGARAAWRREVVPSPPQTVSLGKPYGPSKSLFAVKRQKAALLGFPRHWQAPASPERLDSPYGPQKSTRLNRAGSKTLGLCLGWPVVAVVPGKSMEWPLLWMSNAPKGPRAPTCCHPCRRWHQQSSQKTARAPPGLAAAK